MRNTDKTTTTNTGNTTLPPGNTNTVQSNTGNTNTVQRNTDVIQRAATKRLRRNTAPSTNTTGSL